MDKLLAGTALALTVSFLAPASAQAGRAEGEAAPPTAVVAAPAGQVAGTFMVGDSTTYRIAPLLGELMPDWYLDYERGRPIRTLPSHIDAYLRHNPRPANFVMALGTNRSHSPEWSYSRLRRAIAKLPARTNVFLVMVVRAGRFQADKDAELQRYNGYSRKLAKQRPHTFIVDWRSRVLSDPTLDPVTGISSLLEDGTHETGGPHGDRKGPGVRTYVDLVLKAWRKANRTGR